MMRAMLRIRLLLVAAVLLMPPTQARAFDLFRSEEISIADIQAAFKARTLTCRALVQMYLDRIEAYARCPSGCRYSAARGASRR